MKTYSTTDIIKILGEKQISFFTLADFGRLFEVNNQQTLYKRIQALEKQGIIQKLIKGKYRFVLTPTDDFTTANFLYGPSYVSLESALSFYGIITGFTYQITSITIKGTRSFSVNNKDFSFSQITNSLFWGYEKKDSFLIADREKALLDYVYFSIKGLRHLDWEEIDISEINKQKLVACLARFKNKQIDDCLKRIIL